MERVWDYPRPPAVSPCDRRVRVEFADEVLAESVHALRVLETSHPPTIYIPPGDVRLTLLTASDTRPTWCEFKGAAHYLDAVVGGQRAHAVAWSYAAPTAGYEALRDHDRRSHRTLQRVARHPRLVAIVATEGRARREERA